LFGLFTPRRIAVWATGLLVLTWSLYAYTMATPGYIDRDRRFKAADFIQFYVMGSLVLQGRTDALYDSQAHLEDGRRRIHPELGLYAGHVNYGPQVAVAFAPLALLPFGWAALLFLVLSAALYALAVWLMWRECSALHPYGRLVALATAASPLFAGVIRYGQLSAVSLLIWVIALVAYRRGRPFVAGLAIGCLAFKPQFGLVIGVVLLIARDWRAVAGAAVTALGQLAIGWLVAGTAAMAQYFRTLALLARNPELVQLYPSEVHSIRGFVQLLVPSPTVVAACSFAGIVVALAVAVRIWTTRAPVELRWSEIVLLTVLASPHLLSYDLALLAIPVMVLADWTIRAHQHRLRPLVAPLLVAAYLAPLSSNLARTIHVQLSVVVMVALAGCVYSIVTRRESAGLPRLPRLPTSP
jgi:hypothetical protein